MNNLEPRAKIGDVVIADFRIIQQEVVIEDAIHLNGMWGYKFTDRKWYYKDRHILKNLTTNVSYE